MALNYFLSGRYAKQEGIVITTGYDPEHTFCPANNAGNEDVASGINAGAYPKPYTVEVKIGLYLTKLYSMKTTDLNNTPGAAIWGIALLAFVGCAELDEDSLGARLGPGFLLKPSGARAGRDRHLLSTAERLPAVYLFCGRLGR